LIIDNIKRIILTEKKEDT